MGWIQIDVSSLKTSEYVGFCCFGGLKNKPKQSQSVTTAIPSASSGQAWPCFHGLQAYATRVQDNFVSPGQCPWVGRDTMPEARRKKDSFMIKAHSWRYGLSGKIPANLCVCQSQDRQNRQNIRRQDGRKNFLNLIKQKS